MFKKTIIWLSIDLLHAKEGVETLKALAEQEHNVKICGFFKLTAKEGLVAELEVRYHEYDISYGLDHIDSLNIDWRTEKQRKTDATEGKDNDAMFRRIRKPFGIIPLEGKRLDFIDGSYTFVDPKPCPFCSHTEIDTEDELVPTDTEKSPYGKAIRKTWAYCKRCGACGPKQESISNNPESLKSMALLAWNERKVYKRVY